MRRKAKKINKSLGLSGQILRSGLFVVIFQFILGANAFAQINLSTDTALKLENSNLKLENKVEDVNVNKGFSYALDKVLTKRGLKRENLCDEKNVIAGRILKEYGSVFIVSEPALAPHVCIFKDSEEVEAFQKKAGYSEKVIAGATIQLQTAALEALLLAREKALSIGLDITPRDGKEAGRRSFADTARLWNSRFLPACEYWKKQGKLTDEQIQRLKSLPIKEQVLETLELEKQGIFFSTKFNYSILQSVAAPGTSQHLAMLAFDVNEYENAEIRRILAKYGWYRTVRNDQPHFTFLGHKESELPSLGLKKIVNANGEFWVPDLR